MIVTDVSDMPSVWMVERGSRIVALRIAHTADRAVADHAAETGTDPLHYRAADGLLALSIAESAEGLRSSMIWGGPSPPMPGWLWLLPDALV